MKSIRVCVLSLGCVGGALAFGIVANAAIDLVVPLRGNAAPVLAHGASAAAVETTASTSKTSGAFVLASATAVPADLEPVKVKTIPLLYREADPAETASAAPGRAVAAVPLPRPRPASAQAYERPSLARQPGTLAIAAATKSNQDDDNLLSAGGIDRMKTALALTAEQEEFWPAIAAELQAIGKQIPRGKGAKNQSLNIQVDADTKQRLYWAAAPLITRLSYEQKLKVKQMAHVMGLKEVAEAL